MAKQQQTRTSARKVKDKWKAKGWYNLLAPEMFDRQVIGETPAEDPTKVMGRITEVTVQDITGDFSRMHIKLQFRVTDVRGNDAHTQFVGHDMTSDYIRRLTRRKRTRTDTVVNATTKDAWQIRVKPMAITDRRIQGSKQRAIRQIMNKVITSMAAKSTVGDVVKAVISGEMAKEVATACKPIHPISRVEIRKSEVLVEGAPPTVAEEALPAAEAPAEAPKPPEGPVEEELPPEPPAPPMPEPPAEEEELEDL
ncbi:MAG TPA: 30S ribosomal protein S3ae [Thermoplasmata archaeon]|nr:30S ribosomal protein S3ae [Thermoplasmata archaeon]